MKIVTMNKKASQFCNKLMKKIYKNKKLKKQKLLKKLIIIKTKLTKTLNKRNVLNLMKTIINRNSKKQKKL